MALFLQLATLLVLAFVALEIHLLRTDLSRLPLLLLRQAEEKKDSPIVNVNVGTMPGATVTSDEAKAPEAPAEEALVPSEPEEPEAEPEPAPPPPEPHRGAIAVNTTTSGLTALKCPACQCENSSYRTECFNCGAALR